MGLHVFVKHFNANGSVIASRGFIEPSPTE